MPTLRGLRCYARALVCILAWSGLASSADAQTFPTRPIRLIYAFGAGTNVHSSVLLLAQEAARWLGQPIVVDVRPGAGGRIGLNAMMTAPPDGYTLSQPSMASLVLQGAVDPKLRIEPGRDYVPIILTTDIPFVMVAAPSAPYRDINGLIAYAKANPGKLNIAGGSLYSDSYFAMIQFKALAGIDFLLVPFKSSVEGIPLQLNGQVHVSVFNGIVKPHVDSGKMVAIASTGSQRWDMFPNLPTMQESGVDLTFKTASGVIAPPGTPAAIVTRLHEAFHRAMSEPAVRKRFAELGMVPRSTTPDEYARIIRSELDFWVPVVQKSGIKRED